MCAYSTRFFALCMNQGLGPRQFVYLFGMTELDRKVETAFVREFGRQHPRASGGIRTGIAAPAKNVSIPPIV